MRKIKNKRNIRQPKRSGVESNATKTCSSRRREKRDGFYLEWSRQRYQVARLRELCSAERVLTSAFLQIHDLANVSAVLSRLYGKTRRRI